MSLVTLTTPPSSMVKPLTVTTGAALGTEPEPNWAEPLTPVTVLVPTLLKETVRSPTVGLASAKAPM